jgi:hypothetical protein
VKMPVTDVVETVANSSAGAATKKTSRASTTSEPGPSSR